MSYEGYTQALCQKGHQLPNFPCLYCPEEEQAQREAYRCQAHINNVICGAPVGDCNSVDDTNCDSYGIKKFIKLTEEETRTCNFGHQHAWTAATYKFSEERYYHDSETGKLLPLPQVQVVIPSTRELLDAAEKAGHSSLFHSLDQEDQIEYWKKQGIDIDVDGMSDGG